MANGAFPGVTLFFNSSSAGNGIFINNSHPLAFQGVGRFIVSFENSTAANATFTNNPDTAEVFFGGTAGNAIFTNKGATATNPFSGEVFINGGADAGNATFINNPGTVTAAAGGEVEIGGSASNGTFINTGATVSGARGGSTRLAGAPGANATGANAHVMNYAATVSGDSAARPSFNPTRPGATPQSTTTGLRSAALAADPRFSNSTRPRATRPSSPTAGWHRQLCSPTKEFFSTSDE